MKSMGSTAFEWFIAIGILAFSLVIGVLISFFVGRERKRADKLAKEKAELEKHNQILTEVVNKRPQPGTLSAALKQSSPEMMAVKLQAVREQKGSVVQTVNKERVIEYLNSEGIVFDLDHDGDIALMANGFVYRVFFTTGNSGIFVVRGDLGVTIPKDRRIELELHVSEVHQGRYWPKLVIWETSEGDLKLTGDFGIIMRAGATDKQLSVRVSSAFVAIDAALTEVLKKLNLPKFGVLE
ncbi:YbjN domain-containing protein [Trueperella pyogenes]|uniref:YbjN domain-containing protein n=2 Tax=Actinomycetota TaxID=201174 RepID=UPI000D52DBE0|nr:YbjN domain-containing protein [Trueperella pyogenes]AWG03446.1 hypothetical protein DC090_02770 [Trueperella pyogenes]AWG16177.1 hypothetical protein DDE06_04695 [Trueperella pyogenes]AZR05060.1 hypothetical protein EBQ11_07300 [Trueperella pyogenes]